MIKFISSTSVILKERDKILLRNVLIKRSMVLSDKINSITIELHKVNHKKNLYNRLFMYKEEFNKIKYLLNILT